MPVVIEAVEIEVELACPDAGIAATERIRIAAEFGRCTCDRLFGLRQQLGPPGRGWLAGSPKGIRDLLQLRCQIDLQRLLAIERRLGYPVPQATPIENCICLALCTDVAIERTVMAQELALVTPLGKDIHQFQAHVLQITVTAQRITQDLLRPTRLPIGEIDLGGAHRVVAIGIGRIAHNQRRGRRRHCSARRGCAWRSSSLLDRPFRQRSRHAWLVKRHGHELLHRLAPTAQQKRHHDTQQCQCEREPRQRAVEQPLDEAGGFGNWRFGSGWCRRFLPVDLGKFLEIGNLRLQRLHATLQLLVRALCRKQAFLRLAQCAVRGTNSLRFDDGCFTTRRVLRIARCERIPGNLQVIPIRVTRLRLSCLRPASLHRSLNRGCRSRDGLGNRR